MGRPTLGLIALLLLGTAQAGERVPHDRVLLRGDVPLRLAIDPSPVCALDLRVDAVDGGALVAAWSEALRAGHGDSGLRLELPGDGDVGLRMSAPAPEFPALISTLGAAVQGGPAAASWRGLALVCPGPSKAWIARLDHAFGLPRRVLRTERRPASTTPWEPLSIVRGEPSLLLRWRAGDLSEVEASLALELRRATVAHALAQEEIDATVTVNTAFGPGQQDVSLRVDFGERQAVRPLLDLVKGALAEHQEAPLDQSTLDARWRAQETALLRRIDPPMDRARVLADREDWGADPSADLEAAQRGSARSFHQRCEALDVDRAAVWISHPRPPTHGELRPEETRARNPILEPSFDDEEDL